MKNKFKSIVEESRLLNINAKDKRAILLRECENLMKFALVPRYNLKINSIGFKLKNRKLLLHIYNILEDTTSRQLSLLRDCKHMGYEIKLDELTQFMCIHDYLKYNDILSIQKYLSEPYDFIITDYIYQLKAQKGALDE